MANNHVAGELRDILMEEFEEFNGRMKGFFDDPKNYHDVYTGAMEIATKAALVDYVDSLFKDGCSSDVEKTLSTLVEAKEKMDENILNNLFDAYYELSRNDTVDLEYSNDLNEIMEIASGYFEEDLEAIHEEEKGEQSRDDDGEHDF